jgi:hypothetical protein
LTHCEWERGQEDLEERAMAMRDQMKGQPVKFQINMRKSAEEQVLSWAGKKEM